MQCLFQPPLHMTTPTIFKQYIWLVNTIYRAGIEIPRTTFNRHREAIEDIFGIYIDCDRKDGYRYYIGNGKVLREDTVQNWMLSALTVSNIIGESMNLQHRIALENIPSDGEYLELVIKAMKESKRISVTYRRYQSSEAKTFTLSPYCIKLFRQRWYLLGKFDDGGFAIFSFDRMEDIALTDETFKIEKDFNASDFFSECFGVVIGDGTRAERIVLRAFGREKYYLRDLPLHHTQKELKPRTSEARRLQEENDYSDFEFRLRPTADFKGHIMSRGAWLKVVQPEWLAQEIRQWHEDSIKKYQEN